jgi:hypothetical protein
MVKTTAMSFMCAVYNQSLHRVDWPEGENDPDGKFADMQYHFQFAVGELISRLEPEDSFTLAVYRDVLSDCEDFPLDDDEQERLVNCMEAVIAATEAKFEARQRKLERDRPAQIARAIASAEHYARIDRARARHTFRDITVRLRVPTLHGIKRMLSFKRWRSAAAPQAEPAAA